MDRALDHDKEIHQAMEDPKNKMLGLGIDLSQPIDHERYHRYWQEMGRIEIRCAQKLGECKHELGEVYYYDNPYQRPAGVCFALLHVLDLYTWRVALGFPSWNEQDAQVHRIHCPDCTGTVWEMRRVPREEPASPPPDHDPA